MLQNPNVVVDNPVTVAGGIISVDNFPSTQPVSGSVSVTGTVDSNITNASLAVTGPLTDAELRATPVAVTGTVATTAAITTTSVVAQVSVPNSGSTVVLASDPATRRVIIFVATKAVLLKLGVGATSTSFTYSLPVNSTLEISGWTGNIEAIGVGGTSNVNVTKLS